MKTKFLLLKWLMVLLLLGGATGAWAQSTDTNPDFACISSTEGYWVDLPAGTPGSTYNWTMISGPVG
ncbi:MAG: hypothetical protein HGB12_12705 [Bacteroidetes bacterium]|nr:hypothetical protein [Bacteroidota bacterium]